jgi:hypothetical protein
MTLSSFAKTITTTGMSYVPNANDNCWYGWDSGITFPAGAEVIVTATTGYISLRDGNLNHLTSDTNWWVYVTGRSYSYGPSGAYGIGGNTTVGGSNQSTSFTYTVTFPSPITIAGLQVSHLKASGRAPESGGSSSGYAQLYVNGVITELNTGVIQALYSWEDWTVRYAVSSVKLIVSGSQNGGVEPAEAYAWIGELGIYVATNQFGTIV